VLPPFGAEAARLFEGISKDIAGWRTYAVDIFCMDHVKLGARWTFNYVRGNTYLESDKFPEAAVAYTESYIRDLLSGIGFGEIVVLPPPHQSSLIARKR
jgi:hypothetical protein